MRQEWRKAGGSLLWTEKENSYLSEETCSHVQKVRPTLEKTQVPQKVGKDH